MSLLRVQVREREGVVGGASTTMVVVMVLVIQGAMNRNEDRLLKLGVHSNHLHSEANR